MDVMVTGATGFVGLALCQRLVEGGDRVRAFVRDAGRADSLRQAGIRVHLGTLDDGEALRRAMDGCERVFHLAALAAVWAPDPDAFRRVNVVGTREVLASARSAGVARVVHTSTAAVLGPASNGPVDEDTVRTTPFFSPYERTKAEAEAEVRAFCDEGGDAVVVSPTRVYGPTPRRPLPPMNRLVHAYRAGWWRFLPGDGSAIGNYVDVADVVEGHCLAADRGRRGERYLLGGQDVSFADLFAVLGRVTGMPHWLVPVPRVALMGGARAATTLAAATGRSPLLTPGWVHRFLLDWAMTSAKAERELGYRPRALEAGLARTIAWLGEADR